MIALRRLPAVLMAAAALTAAAAPAASAKAKLTLGVYDCEAYNYASGLLDYHGSVKLKARGRYESGADRHGSKLKKPHRGRYAIRGSWIRFKSGAYRKTPGRIYPKDASHGHAYFSLYANGESTGVACYFVPGT